MELSPEERERIYQEEKAKRTEKPQEEKSILEKDMNANCCLMLVIGIFLIFIAIYFIGSPETRSPSSTASYANSDSASSYTPTAEYRLAAVDQGSSLAEDSSLIENYGYRLKSIQSQTGETPDFIVSILLNVHNELKQSGQFVSMLSIMQELDEILKTEPSPHDFPKAAIVYSELKRGLGKK